MYGVLTINSDVRRLAYYMGLHFMDHSSSLIVPRPVYQESSAAFRYTPWYRHSTPDIALAIQLSAWQLRRV